MLQPRDKIVENNRARKETEIEPIRKWKMPKEAVPVNAMGFHLELNKKEGRETLSKRGRDSLARKRKREFSSFLLLGFRIFSFLSAWSEQRMTQSCIFSEESRVGVKPKA